MGADILQWEHFNEGISKEYIYAYSIDTASSVVMAQGKGVEG